MSDSSISPIVTCDKLYATEVNACQYGLIGLGGELAARLEIDPETGLPMFALLDAKGQIRIEMKLRSNGDADISLSDSAGLGALLLRVEGENERPQIAIHDAGGAQRLVAGLTPEGDPAVQLSDGDQTRLSMGLEDGRPRISHFGDDGHLKATVRELPDGSMEFSEFVDQ